jgi:hypothetical protein
MIKSIFEIDLDKALLIGGTNLASIGAGVLLKNYLSKKKKKEDLKRRKHTVVLRSSTNENNIK